MKCKSIQHVIIIFLMVSLMAISTPNSLADTEAPIITIQTEHCVISETWAIIHWETDEPASGGVEWGLTSQYGNISYETGDYVTQHSINLTGLTRNTNYYVRIFANDSSGNTGNYSFELGTYPMGIETLSDYIIIIVAVVIIIFILSIAIYIFYNRKKKG